MALPAKTLKLTVKHVESCSMITVPLPILLSRHLYTFLLCVLVHKRDFVGSRLLRCTPANPTRFVATEAELDGIQLQIMAQTLTIPHTHIMTLMQLCK